MSGSHLLRDGTWMACADATCPARFHVAGLTPTQAFEIPLSTMLPLFEITDPPREIRYGIKRWSRPDGRLHRAYGLPAVVHENGDMEWHRQGKPHRDHDLPASVFADGRRLWRRDGHLHRETGPAVVRPGGTIEWWLNGQRHRVDGPALIEADGTQWWFEANAPVGYGPDRAEVPVRAYLKLLQRMRSFG